MKEASGQRWLGFVFVFLFFLDWFLEEEPAQHAASHVPEFYFRLLSRTSGRVSEVLSQKAKNKKQPTHSGGDVSVASAVTELYQLHVQFVHCFPRPAGRV